MSGSAARGRTVVEKFTRLEGDVPRVPKRPLRGNRNRVLAQIDHLQDLQWAVWRQPIVLAPLHLRSDDRAC
jgi:hypothetical protein